MKSVLVKLVAALFASVGFSALILAQPQAQQTQPQQAPPQQTQPLGRPPTPYRASVFDVKYRDPEALANAIQPLLSGAPGVSMVSNRQMKTITVRDYPENLESIREALKRLDVPDTAYKPNPPASIEFQLHLIAAASAAGEKSQFPAALESVVNQLKSTLRFGSYRYLTTFTNRVNEGGIIDASGVISPPFPLQGSSTLKSGYNYSIRTPQSSVDTTGKEVILTNSFSFRIEVPVEVSPGNHAFREVKLSTQLTLRDGETAVVGTANAGSTDEAIIVVVSARKLK